MPRRLITLLIALYAIAFAFGAMAAIRWPSLMLLATLMLEEQPMAGLENIDWRQIGIVYGAPYFLAALCLYASAISLNKRRKGAMAWYLMGCIAGFPCVFLVDFEAGWWRDPSIGEGGVAGAAAAAILLAIAVWNLRRRRRKLVKAVQPQPAAAEAIIAPPPVEPKPKRTRVYRPVPAAIARQRAHFAAEGRRMLERQRRR